MAQYRYNTLSESKAEWTTLSGAAIEVIYRLSEEQSDYFGDGDYKRTTRGLSIQLETKVNGRSNGTLAWIETVAGRTDGIIAKIANVGLTNERLAMVKVAKAAVEAHPEWQAHLAATARGEHIMAQHDADQRRLDNIMTLGGRSY
jgi:hypothetical protein